MNPPTTMPHWTDSERERAREHPESFAMGMYYTLAELCASVTAVKYGLDNTPPDRVIFALLALVRAILDPLRVKVARPVHVEDAYRSPAVELRVTDNKPQPNGQHPMGRAADILVRGYTAEELALVIIRLKLPFDQLIVYSPKRGGHVHVSHVDGGPNRGQLLYAPPGGGWVPWTPPAAPPEPAAPSSPIASLEDPAVGLDSDAGGVCVDPSELICC